MNLIIERGLDRAKMIRLLRLVDWVMRLPEDLKSEFHRTVREISERKSMPILMNIEIEAMERGIAEGLAEGAANAKRSALLRILELRFGRIPEVLARTVAATNDVARLDAAIELAVLAPSIDEFRSRCPFAELSP